MHLKNSIFGKACLLCTVVVLAVFGVLLVTGYFSAQPSNTRNWSRDQLVLPEVSYNGSLVTISNVRNFTYTDKDTFEPRYYTKTYNLDELATLDYVVEKFSGIGAAHTFLSFGFTDGSYVAISAEIRKEVGETFSPLSGLFRAYELMYVIADERDVITLRVMYRNDPVYVYPTKASTTDIRTLFLSMTERAETLRTSPEFYNTLTNTCMTNIVMHINQIAPHTIPWDVRILFPRYSDVMAYELGLLDTTVPIDELRKTYLVNERVTRYVDDPDFSKKIRGL